MESLSSLYILYPKLIRTSNNLSFSFHIFAHLNYYHCCSLTDEDEADLSLEQCKVWEERLDQRRRYLQVSQKHSLQHQQLSFFKGKASQRTRQFGFLASPITESWSLDLLTLNRGALSEIRSDPSYHHSDHSEDHYFQYLKPVSEIKHWI